MTKPDVVLLDIEGTITSIEFVHQVLFPLSLKKMDSFIEENISQADLSTTLMQFAQKENIIETGRSAIVPIANRLKELVKNDVKDPTLKLVQGKIWKSAFEREEVKSDIYEDAFTQMQKWHSEGIRLYIYSSGSVEAQKLVFQYSVFGDLRHLISGYFDTRVGGKKEVDSYKKIVKEIGITPEKIFFLTDISEEAFAAQQASINVARVIRPGTISDGKFFEIKNFVELSERWA